MRQLRLLPLALGLHVDVPERGVQRSFESAGGFVDRGGVAVRVGLGIVVHGGEFAGVQLLPEGLEVCRRHLGRFGRGLAGLDRRRRPGWPGATTERPPGRLLGLAALLHRQHHRLGLRPSLQRRAVPEDVVVGVAVAVGPVNELGGGAVVGTTLNPISVGSIGPLALVASLFRLGGLTIVVVRVGDHLEAARAGLGQPVDLGRGRLGHHQARLGHKVGRPGGVARWQPRGLPQGVLHVRHLRQRPVHHGGALPHQQHQLLHREVVGRPFDERVDQIQKKARAAPGRPAQTAAAPAALRPRRGHRGRPRPWRHVPSPPPGTQCPPRPARRRSSPATAVRPRPPPSLPAGSTRTPGSPRHAPAPQRPPRGGTRWQSRPSARPRSGTPRTCQGQ
mmetsp:Transcript_23836/g.71120  ORF Transcript_23836/g.71120 Transcript_23836/m.71120 type:complete len:391 (-) Transcript_23836:296-1468(-)